MKKVCLVFSGGGLRGFTQIGSLIAIKEFLKIKNYQVKYVVGTSFGSISASIFATGLDTDYIKNYLLKKHLKLRELIDFKIFGSGVLRGKKLQKFIKDFLPIDNFSKTKTELLIHTANILDGQEFLFSKDGLLSIDKKLVSDKTLTISQAIGASCAIPGIFNPTIYNDLILVDGGLVSPIAFNAVKQKDYDLIIGVDVSMGNFNFINSSNPTKIQMIAQTVSISQRIHQYAKVNQLAKKRKIILIRPPIGPVNIRKKGEFERMLNCGYSEAKKILKF